MGRNLSFHYVIKNVREREGVDISSLILKIKNQDVVSLDVEEVSTEYKDLTEKYKQISRRQSSGEEPSAEDQHTVALWGQAHDKAQAIIQEAYDNIWFFFRDILRVPHMISPASDIPTDMRKPEDFHFQMSEWGAKVLWLYENEIHASINMCNNIQFYELLAGISMYEMFRLVVDYTKQGASAFEHYHPMTLVGYTEYVTVGTYLRITNIVWMMIRELEHYSFLVDIADKMLEMIDMPVFIENNEYKLCPAIMKTVDKRKKIEDSDGMLINLSGLPSKKITKRENAEGGLLNVINTSIYDFHEHPELTFEYILKDISGYFARSCDAMFSINAGIYEFIDNRIPGQKLYIQQMVHDYSMFISDRYSNEENLKSATTLYRNSIGYVYAGMIDDADDVYRETMIALNYIYSKYTK